VIMLRRRRDVAMILDVIMLLRGRDSGVGDGVDVEARTSVPLKNSTLTPPYTSSYALLGSLLCLVHSPDVPAERSLKPCLPPNPCHVLFPRR